MDTFSAAERSSIMRRVKSQNTTPERIVGRFIRSFGYRQKLNCKDLPGSPDIVLPGKRIAIFVHGCFWHGHHCPDATLPKSNRSYWKLKQARNMRRDRRSARALRKLNWKVLTLWECQIGKTDKLKRKFEVLLNQ
jgi:DNA mismatch endonuclease (patch repair protein)